MSMRVRWLLVVILGLMIHFKLTTLVIANWAPYQNGVRFLIPFGNIRYYDAMSVATVEWLLILILWIVFAVLFLRRSGE